MRPQSLVDLETVPHHGIGRCHRPSVVGVVDRRVVGRIVVDEVTHVVPTEVRVGLRVEDERVPPDVDELGRVEVPLRLELDEREEPESLIHDPLGEVPLDALVLDDAIDETLPERVVDKLLVGELDTRLRLNGGEIHDSHVAPFLLEFDRPVGLSFLHHHHSHTTIVAQISESLFGDLEVLSA